MGYVYILKLVNERYYVGSTIDIDRRFLEHQSGEVLSTANLRPLELVFFQRYPTPAEARKIEYKLKKLKSRKIIEQIVQDKIIHMRP